MILSWQQLFGGIVVVLAPPSLTHECLRKLRLAFFFCIGLADEEHFICY